MKTEPNQSLQTISCSGTVAAEPLCVPPHEMSDLKRWAKIMSSASLTSYWIEGPDPKGPIGYGVTAFSLEDAFSVITSLGYSLPENKEKIAYRIIRSVDEVPYDFVRRNSGPIIVRGLWAPFSRIGVQA